MQIANAETLPLNIVGSSVFGRYPKISAEHTYNMFMTDGWLVNYAGYQLITDFSGEPQGRGLFHSVRGGFMLAVVGSNVYRIGANLGPILIGNLATSRNEVYIDENLNSQICIVDGFQAYIYSYLTGELAPQTLTYTNDLGTFTVVPGYVCYHNTFFLIASAPTSQFPQNWYVFQPDAISLNAIDFVTQLALQTKPDNALAVVRLPGRGNYVLVLGSTVAELYNNVGGTLNYQRAQSFNIDSGTVSVATIAASDEFVAWIGQNEKSSPTLIISDGNSAKHISTDGISHLLQTIQHPDQSTAFFFRQDGHLFYQFTFYNPVDNLTMTYDVNDDKFYDITDENEDFHPARQVAYFNLNTYFISLNDSGLYQMGTQFISYNYNASPLLQGFEIPRIRIPSTIRMEDSSPFRVGELRFGIEQGVTDYVTISETCVGELITESGHHKIVTEQGFNILEESGYCFTGDIAPRVDMSFSKNGNQSFSNIVSKDLNPQAQFRNILRWTRMGHCNEFTSQFRFHGFQRFVVRDGVIQVYT